MVSVLSPDKGLLRSTYEWLAHSGCGVTEIRIIEQGAERSKPLIAYVDNADTFVDICASNNATANVYVGIQPRPLSLLDRSPNRVGRAEGGKIADIEIVCSQVIDIDPKRPKDHASTDAELAEAIRAAELITAKLTLDGFVPPQMMLSGNGVQLWFAFAPIVLDETNRESVIENARLFEIKAREYAAPVESVSVDSIHDIARIIKAIGSVSRKGENTDARPHRLSQPLEGSSLTVRPECPKLRESLLRPVEKPQTLALTTTGTSRLPVFQPGTVAAPVDGLKGEAELAKNPDGSVNWGHAIEMCGPVQRVWDEGWWDPSRGKVDRSVSLFAMILWWLSRGYSEEITEQAIFLYDLVKTKKLTQRDARKYIRNEIRRAIDTSGGIDKVKPACKKLQQNNYCPVNNDPAARCELFDVIFSVEASITELPTQMDPHAFPYRAKPLIQSIAEESDEMRALHVKMIAERTSLPEDYVSQQIFDVWAEQAFEGTDPDAAAVPASAPAALPIAPTIYETKIDGQIYEELDHYFVSQGPKSDPRVISSFALRPRSKLMLYDQPPVFVCDADCDNGRTVKDIQFPRKAFRTTRTLLDALSEGGASEHTQWTGTDRNVQGLLRQIASKNIPEKKGVTTMGEVTIDGERFWALPDRVITKDGIVEDPPVMYLRNNVPLEHKVRFDEYENGAFHDVAEVIFDQILNVNTPDVLLPILGWFCATPMKPRLMEAIGSFPILWVHGTQGSGKTALVNDIFWRMFGIAEATPFSSNQTEWALIRLLSSTNCIPLFLDEYKLKDQSRREHLHRLVRENFTGEIQTRGNRSLGLGQWKLSAPLVIAGETRTTEAAILERLITSRPDKVELGEHSEWHDAFVRLREVDLTRFAARYIRFCMGRDLAPDLDSARTAVENSLPGLTIEDPISGQMRQKKIPIRVRHNLTVVALGLHLFEQFAIEIGYYRLPNDIGFRGAVRAICDDLVETESGVKDPLDHFLETLAVMATLREIIPGQHYAFAESNTNHLCVDPHACYALYRKHLRMTDYRDDIPSKKDLELLIQQNFQRQGYIRQVEARMDFGNGNRRASIVFDLSGQTLVQRAQFPDSDERQQYSPGRQGWHDY